MKERQRGLNFLVGNDIQQKVEVQSFRHEWGKPFAVPHLIANPDPPIKNNLMSGIGMITVIIL